MKKRKSSHRAAVLFSVVSDIPDDIDLSGFDLINDEKVLIRSGIPLVRACILSEQKDVLIIGFTAQRTRLLSEIKKQFLISYIIGL